MLALALLRRLVVRAARDLVAPERPAPDDAVRERRAAVRPVVVERVREADGASGSRALVATALALSALLSIIRRS